MNVIQTNNDIAHGQTDEEGEDEYEITGHNSYHQTLRSSVCYTLGQLSKKKPEQTLTIFMPLMEEAVKSDTAMKEAAILILGTICDEDACQSLIEQFLPSLLPFLASEISQPTTS